MTILLGGNTGGRPYSRPVYSWSGIPIFAMAQWPKAAKRDPLKTKAEVREMLAEAVRNTDCKSARDPKTKVKGSQPRPNGPR
jgi:hypothetical protein